MPTPSGWSASCCWPRRRAGGGSAIILHVDQVFTDAIEFAFVLAELVRCGTTFSEWGASLWMMRCPGSV